MLGPDILTFSGLAAWDEGLWRRRKKLAGCQRKRGVLGAGTSVVGKLVFSRRSLKKGRKEGHEDRQERYGVTSYKEWGQSVGGWGRSLCLYSLTMTQVTSAWVRT